MASESTAATPPAFVRPTLSMSSDAFVVVGDDGSLSQWQRRYRVRVATENMMRWQRYYSVPCGRVCCFSKLCGCIKCSACKRTLTTLPPRTRFTCMGCELASADDEPLTLCEACFASAKRPHEHARWAMVDEQGHHVVVERQVGVAEPVILREADLAIVTLAELPADARSCAVLDCDFEDDNPAATLPGCARRHGLPAADKERGWVDSGLACRACLLQWLRAAGKDHVYPACDGTLRACVLCDFEDEVAGWRADFEAGFSTARAAYNAAATAGCDVRTCAAAAFDAAARLLTLDAMPAECASATASWADVVRELGTQLRDLHPQPWLRAEVDRVFRAADGGT